MQQNIVTIEVPASLSEPAQDLTVGNMYEHNATALEFVLDASLVSADYKYYLEFVTLGGVSRTEYLTPDEAGKILFSVPQAVTAQMTALCVLNIVQVSEDGVTEQLIKAQTVRLHFSPLENTEKRLCADYEFTINSLLTAIENDTFKGDKGDKGDAYILTDADKTEIASQVDEAFYGLPMQKRMTVQGEAALPTAADSGAVQSLCVSPAADTLDGIADTQIAVGENLIAWLLDSAQYKAFSNVQGSYAGARITLTPGKQYVLTRLQTGISQNVYAYLKVGSTNFWFCHKSESLNSKGQLTFTAPADGVCELVATFVFNSAQNYKTVLETDWQGLGIYKVDAVLLQKKSFSEPLRAVGGFADSYDFASGATTRRTQAVTLSADMLSGDAPTVLQSGENTAYRYSLTLPAELPARHMQGTAVLCSDLPAMPSDVTTAAEYEAYMASTGNAEGVFLDASNRLTLLSAQPAEQIESWLSAQAPVLLYETADRVTAGEAQQLSLPQPTRQIQVSPPALCAEVAYAADISAVAADFEERLAALENIL